MEFKMKNISTFFAAILIANVGYCMKVQNLCTDDTKCIQTYLGNKIIADCSYDQIMSDDNPPQPTNLYLTDCIFKYMNAKGESSQLKTDVDMERDATLVWYNNQYAAINATEGTGTANQYISIIFDFKDMTHIPILENFITLDPKRNLIAINGQYIDNENKVANLQKILITGLYDHSRGMLINFPADADVSMIADPSQSKFNNQGNLVLNYSTTDFDTNTVTIPIDTSKFVPLDPVMIKNLGLDFSVNS